MTKTYSYIILAINLYAVLGVFTALLLFARQDARQAKLRQVFKPMTIEQINGAILAQQDIEHLRKMSTNLCKALVDTRDAERSSIDGLRKEIENGWYSLGVVAAGGILF